MTGRLAHVAASTKSSSSMSHPVTDDVVWMMYAPYLPLRERHEIDGWVSMPASELGEDDVATSRRSRSSRTPSSAASIRGEDDAARRRLTVDLADPPHEQPGRG